MPSTSPPPAPEALRKALDGGYDAAVMDVMLPELDGLSVIEQLRAKKQQMPVLILSARHTVDDRVKGLQAGGDDYLTKPFAFAELLARVAGAAAAQRRHDRADAAHRRRPDARSAVAPRRARPGRRSILRPREFALLEYLMRHPGRVLSKTMILSHVWGYSFDPGTNVVDVLVSRLRDKVDEGVRHQVDPHGSRRRLCPQSGLIASARRSACGWRRGISGPSSPAPS